MILDLLTLAKKQLHPVSVDQIKSVLKKSIPKEYDKMVINNSTKIETINYSFYELKYKLAKKKLIGIVFPLYDRIKNDFIVFEGGIPKLGEKVIVENKSLIEAFEIQKGAIKKELPQSKIEDAFTFPFEILENEINPIQKKYFFPKYTYQEECTYCKGKKYITCTNNECNGKHTWKCKTCIGKGELVCSNCKGHGYTRCSSCKGLGKKMVTTKYSDGRKYKKAEQCSNCIGKGQIPCENCGTSGKIRCEVCKGEGEFTCDNCYSDLDRKGMIDCPACLTTGKTVQMAYVETIINNLSKTKLIQEGEDFEVEESIIKNHIKHNLHFKTIYKNINGNITGNTDDISKNIIPDFESEINFSKSSFPILLKEEILYQIIPCIKFSYKHILTNKFNELTIVDIWDNPEIIFHSNAEELKVSVNSVFKTVSSVFSKVFKTDAYKNKEDKKIEIKLMIYLAKSDGEIKEVEKEFLSEQISNLKDFKNSEKKYLYDLMNADELPQLNKSDVLFSNPKRGIEIIDKLTELANSDGEFEEVEKNLIKIIKDLIV